MSPRKNKQNSEHYRSDSDDWTLVSNPNSSSSSTSSLSSSSDKDTLEINLPETPANDGLMDIDLNEPVENPNVINQNQSPDLIMPGSEAADSTSDEAEDNHDKNGDDGDDEQTQEDEAAIDYQESSRGSSLTRSELEEYIDLGKQQSRAIRCSTEVQNEQPNNSMAILDTSAPKHELPQIGTSSSHLQTTRSIKGKLDELSEAATVLAKRRPIIQGQISTVMQSAPITRQWVTIHLLVLITHIFLNQLIVDRKSAESTTEHPEGCHIQRPMSRLGEPDSVFVTNEMIELELKALNEELLECLRRQNPDAYKYYKSSSNMKRMPQHYRRLACFGKESYWRRRFERLRNNFGVDIEYLISEAKKAISSEIIESHYTKLPVRLIVNQQEFLGLLESGRNTKESEEKLRDLRRENLRLIRQLSNRKSNPEPSNRLLINSLEKENVKLINQVEALKASLSEKAGPTFIRQSQELERLMKENSMLKEFHLELAQDVVSNLKLFNLHTVGAFANIGDQKSLEKQTSQIRTYMARLNERIRSMQIENEDFKAELKHLTDELLAISSRSVPSNMLTISQTGEQSKRSLVTTGLDSVLHRSLEERLFLMKHENITMNNCLLSAEDCHRDLRGTREKLHSMVGELNRLRRECQSPLRDGSNESDKAEPKFHKTRLPITNGALSRIAKKSDYVFGESANDLEDDLTAFLGKITYRMDQAATEIALLQVQKAAPESTSGYIDEENVKLAKWYAENLIEPVSKVGPPSPHNHIELANETSSNDTQSTSEEAHDKLADKSSHTDHSWLGVPPTVESCPQMREEAVWPTSSMNLEQPSWFFERARQRSQLREPISPSIGSDWVLKRAKLREKLRRVSLYMEQQNYLPRNYMNLVKDESAVGSAGGKWPRQPKVIGAFESKQKQARRKSAQKARQKVDGQLKCRGCKSSAKRQPTAGKYMKGFSFAS